MSQWKQSLFALMLILWESSEKWPLLIDQPEDDLDARSIYDEIVPFLKLKKKERQINKEWNEALKPIEGLTQREKRVNELTMMINFADDPDMKAELERRSN